MSHNVDDTAPVSDSIAVCEQAVFEDLKALLTETLGEDVADIIGIERSSTFLGDLGLDSIKIVTLGEELNIRYGEKIDLMGWLQSLPIPRLLKLKVGDLSHYIAEKQAETGGAV